MMTKITIELEIHPSFSLRITLPPYQDGQEETKNGLTTSTIAPAKEKEEKERQKEG